MFNRKIDSKKILLVFVFVVIISVFYYLGVGKFLKEIVISFVPKWRYSECVKNLDLKKIDFTSKKFSLSTDDELAYILLNYTATEAFLNNDGMRCLYFTTKGDTIHVNSLFSHKLCWSKQQSIQMAFDFAEKLKQKMPEETFIKECQSFLIEKMFYFKEDVPENLREEHSKAFCQSVYSSYQKGEIVLGAAFLSDSNWPSAVSCNCFDSAGKQRTCRSEFCDTMNFFAAVSKNDQSLCPKVTDVKVLPYCSLYFDNQSFKKYEDIFKDRYCKKM